MKNNKVYYLTLVIFILGLISGALIYGFSVNESNKKEVKHELSGTYADNSHSGWVVMMVFKDGEFYQYENSKLTDQGTYAYIDKNIYSISSSTKHNFLVNTEDCFYYYLEGKEKSGACKMEFLTSAYTSYGTDK